MATKMTKAAPPNGMHTAGIFSDMTVDGPVIGTLVIIVDRAKNLPNRKSIGKQDPYCAARLGKEAKKTETDRRGGQTPKWDQELRFTVHDSPDYYQLKVSVFNDDKKTDLIGETWVNLQDVVVPGGGQNDLWHNLAYRGKYAGEIRIEMTYYDTRPKQEKASEKARQATPNGAVDAARDQMTGPRQPKPPMKRRPLPADPTATSPSPVIMPDHAHISPKGYQTPPSYVHAQSPLQSVEYNTPQKFSQSQQEYGSTRAGINEYSTPPAMVADSHAGNSRFEDRYESYDPADSHQVNAASRRGRYEDQVEDQRRNPHSSYNMQDLVHELPVPHEYDPPLDPEGPPPLPPKHRSNHASLAFHTPQTGGRPEPLQVNTIRTVSYEASPQDNYRHSVPEYGENTTYQAYSPLRHRELQPSFPDQDSYEDASQRHHSYDERTSESYRSMQPTVEDDVSSTPKYPSRNDRDQHLPQYDERRYDQIPPTAPLNLSGRGSASPSNYAASGTSSHSRPPPSVSPVSYRDPHQLDSDVSSQTSYGHHSQQGYKDYSLRSHSEDQLVLSSSGYIPSIPPTLVAGMDPVIAQEVSERMYTENRANYSQGAGSARSRYSQQLQHRYSHAQPHRQEVSSSAAPLVPAVANHEELQSRAVINSYTPVVKPRAVSPDPRVPPRKSISPSPAHSPAHSGSGRQLSGVPFGPDAYEALNPAVSSSPAQSQMIAKFDSPVLPGQHDNSDPGAKIIMHDGREVDPSDHLPEASWAPEPEVRGLKQQAVSLYGRGAQSTPSSGPRPLRQPARPYSMIAPSSSALYPTDGYSGPSTPASNPGRTRLQKKANRSSMTPGSAPQSSPLALVNSYEEDHFAPRTLQKAHTMDFSGEHGYRSHGNSRGDYYDAYRHNSMNGPPPIPAKIPMNHGHPMPPNESAWNLLEEIKTIDLGAGRARRRGHTAA